MIKHKAKAQHSEIVGTKVAFLIAFIIFGSCSDERKLFEFSLFMENDASRAARFYALNTSRKAEAAALYPHIP